MFYVDIKCRLLLIEKQFNYNICPCFANIFSEYNQQDATFLNVFISVRRSTCFRRFFRPSSGAQNCTYSVRPLLLPAASVTVWQIPDAVCAVLSSWWWTEKPSETCRASYLLTPWCRVILEKLTGLQLVKKFPTFHGTRRFITALTSVRYMSLSWASPIQSTYPHLTSWSVLQK